MSITSIYTSKKLLVAFGYAHSSSIAELPLFYMLSEDITIPLALDSPTTGTDSTFTMGRGTNTGTATN